jgi:hypothetical protein
MPLYNFQKRFAPKVESGEKLQTIRRRRKYPTRAGETPYLYSGLRTKAPRKLRDDNPKCTNVLPIEIHEERAKLKVKVGPEWLSESELDAFALADGFADARDFHLFWSKVHGLRPSDPLIGFDLIQWEPKQEVVSNAI